MLGLLSANPIVLLVRAISVLAAITIHEFFHGLAADKLGDPTPRINDRITLNPLKHLDPIGTLALFFVGVGWAKPVPIDPFNFRHRKRDTAIVSLAGPMSNFVSALLVALVAKYILPMFFPLTSMILWVVDQLFVFPFVAISIGLAIFNLMPIPPLDGSKILFSLLPNHITYQIEEPLERYGLIILMLLVFPLLGGQPLINKIIGPIITIILNLLL